MTCTFSSKEHFGILDEFGEKTDTSHICMFPRDEALKHCRTYYGQMKARDCSETRDM